MTHGLSLTVWAYRLGSAIHWPSREAALRRALDWLAQNRVDVPTRLVDVGSGLGQLARVAAERDVDYLGIEPDDVMRAHARKVNGGGVSDRFVRGTASDVGTWVRPGDAVILNGVAHHLEDNELGAVLSAARHCTVLIICDHHRDPLSTRGVTRWLQDHDRGRYIRDHHFFDRLACFEQTYGEVFSIGPAGTRLWSYFCNVYLPN